MGIRSELKPGSIIKMPNKGCYIICEKIGEGGFSLIYSGKTMTNEYPVIIKEYFPADYAHRAMKTKRSKDGTIIEHKNCVYPDICYEECFAQGLHAFENEGKLGIQAHMISHQIIAFSDCGNGYAILPRWSQSFCTIREIVDKWRLFPPESLDRHHSDHGRIYFSMRVASSLLNVMSLIHGQGILHLDISPDNVVWAGNNQVYDKSGTAFLLDFGCAVVMTEGTYPSEKTVSCNKKYAAPEYVLRGGELTPSTDIFSIGRLLAYMCFGDRALYSHADLRNLGNRLSIQGEDRDYLIQIIQRATSPLQENRYQSASEMQHDIEKVLENLTPGLYEHGIFRRFYPIFQDEPGCS